MKSLKPITKIQVGNDECASCYTGNSFSGLFRTGTHLSENIDKVVFVDTSTRKEKFGIRAPNYPITLDKMSFGFSGNISFKILDENAAIASFISNIVQGKQDFNSKDILMPVITFFISGGAWKEATLTLGPIVLSIGHFTGALMNFIIIALIVFMIMGQLKKTSIK